MSHADALGNYARLAYRNPREAADGVLSLRLPREALAAAVGLMAILNTFLSGIYFADFVASYLTLAASSLAILVIFYVAVWLIGRAFGGRGSLEETFQILVFAHAIFLPLHLVQLLLVSLSPTLAAVSGLAITVFTAWVYVTFVQVLHGFRGFGKAFAILVLSVAGLLMAVFLLRTILVALGVA